MGIIIIKPYKDPYTGGDFWNAHGLAENFRWKIKHDQILVRSQEPFHILHRPRLRKKAVFRPHWKILLMVQKSGEIFTTWSCCFFLAPNNGIDSPYFNWWRERRMYGDQPSKNMDLMEWSTLRHDLSVPWQWGDSVSKPDGVAENPWVQWRWWVHPCMTLGSTFDVKKEAAFRCMLSEMQDSNFLWLRMPWPYGQGLGEPPWPNHGNFPSISEVWITDTRSWTLKMD